MAAEVEVAAMRRALDAARATARTLPNPRVGCVLLAPDGTELAVGAHHGAGSPHAEVEALTRAGEAARGEGIRDRWKVVRLDPSHRLAGSASWKASAGRRHVWSGGVHR